MRKTNLFYIEDNKSNFLTFSNYGEYLTGVCLSTNHKIFPASFICLDLPFNETHTLDEFKKFLMCYYENKLAWIRDQFDIQDRKFEDSRQELNYLLEAIYLFFDNNTIDIKYFGDIVEHDYNGTYNDSICIVDFNKIKKSNISYIDIRNNVYNKQNLNLYNWNDELDMNIFHAITDIDIYIEDNPNYSYKNSDVYIENNFINFEDLENTETQYNDKTEISFNCIIPLFDVINISIEENTDNINEDFDENNKYKRIPYGIWFSSERSDNTLNNITLYKNNDNISQSWSLVISSKFAPYPLGVKIDDNNIDNIEKYTYAELLSKNSELLEKYNDLTEKYFDILSEMSLLKNKINNLEQLGSNSVYSLIDEVNDKLYKYDVTFNSTIKELKEKFDEQMNSLKWKAINTSD